MRSLHLAALVLLANSLPTRSQNLLGDGSFEEPKVAGRTAREANGNPALATVSPWAGFSFTGEASAGRLSAGMTNEIARTGTQSLYLDFEKLTGSSPKVALVTKLIPIQPQQPYRISIWGRIDPKRPLALDERRPVMGLNIEFFTPEKRVIAEETTQGAQPIPGNIIPGGPHNLVFLSRKWSESFARVTTPANAAFVQVTWAWEIPGATGETDGVVFWDDAALEHEAQPPVAPSGGAPAATK